MRVIDLVNFVPKMTPGGKEILLHKDEAKIIVYTAVKGWSNGKWPKEFALKRYMMLDALALEGLGLWVGEGGKNKGIYFGNTSPELLLNFLKFVEEKLGLSREMFKVTVNSPRHEADLKERWSKILQIPTKNFTNMCLDARINHEYAQIYLNSVILVEVMKNLQEKLRPMIL